ncbi:hypothetical protein RSOLAG1IB_01908 [Rhizoctonia solani AG-1 IB]|uniref:Small nuclear ribonucleoprotein Prp3 C-terminal domain-containing protein n=1 Tax=Thanatephorus cucumeris (strain AG1-IB / isolate 7/3/14) TaxID=1108050 RepID=A0A0B7FCX1_THACB|nr:hypothetical protein RSOLAG1IB_01908 [Rhizoctonia solani AG-1 IB]
MTLSNDVLEAQKSIVDLLMSMFLGLGELDLDDESQTVLAVLTEYLDAPDSFETVPALANIHVTIHLSISSTRTIALLVVIHLRSPSLKSGSPPLLEVSIKHPSWLPRTEYERLLTSLPPYTGSSDRGIQGSEDGRDWLMQTIEYFDSEDTKKALLTEQTSSLPVVDNVTLPRNTTITRAWFYLPSLSTRSKRDDMVRLAPKYSITGFVLAGKPGLLCIEAPSPSAPDAFISEVKTVSWADIPSHQKKITERHREFNLPVRAFEDMREVTEMISTRGARGNRGNMGEVRVFLEEKGLKGVLEIVLGATEFK